jgi:hypothetical protein
MPCLRPHNKPPFATVLVEDTQEAAHSLWKIARRRGMMILLSDIRRAASIP